VERTHKKFCFFFGKNDKNDKNEIKKQVIYLRITPQEISRRHRELRLTSRGDEQKSLGSDKNDNKNEIKTQVIYLYVCYPPGLEDCSSRPGMMMWETRSKSSFWFLRTKKFVTKSYKRCVCVCV